MIEPRAAIAIGAAVVTPTVMHALFPRASKWKGIDPLVSAAQRAAMASLNSEPVLGMTPGTIEPRARVEANAFYQALNISMLPVRGPSSSKPHIPDYTKDDIAELCERFLAAAYEGANTGYALLNLPLGGDLAAGTGMIQGGDPAEAIRNGRHPRFVLNGALVPLSSLGSAMLAVAKCKDRVRSAWPYDFDPAESALLVGTLAVEMDAVGYVDGDRAPSAWDSFWDAGVFALPDTLSGAAGAVADKVGDIIGGGLEGVIAGIVKRPIVIAAIAVGGYAAWKVWKR